MRLVKVMTKNHKSTILWKVAALLFKILHLLLVNVSSTQTIVIFFLTLQIIFKNLFSIGACSVIHSKKIDILRYTCLCVDLTNSEC